MRKRLTQEDILNKWLGDYHGTSVDQVKVEHPDWAENPQEHSRDFYEAYMVTQAQHDEWHDWLIDALAKDFRVSMKAARKDSWAIYLNCSPQVKID